MKHLTAIFATLLLAACSAADDSYNSWNSQPADLSRTVSRFRTILESGEEELLSQDEILTMSLYGIQSDTSDYILPDTFHLRSRGLHEAVNRYNSYIVLHNLYSQYELFQYLSEMQYDYDWVMMMETIMGYSSGNEDDVAAATAALKNKLCSYIGSAAFGSVEDEGPGPYFQEAFSLLDNNPFADFSDTTALFRCIDLQNDWADILQSDEFQAIDSISDNTRRTVAFLDAVGAAGSFERQCQLALASVGRIPFEVSVTLMKQLLESGRYSRYQFVMWLGWRSSVQYIFYGLSRDSRIADQLYNETKNRAYAASLVYCDANPKDYNARLIIEFFCSTGNIVRSGSYANENDARSDYELIFSR